MVSSVQSSVLFVIPGNEGSKGDIATPNILADPSHLNKQHLLNCFRDPGTLTGVVPYWRNLDKEVVLDRYPRIPEVAEVCLQSIQTPASPLTLVVAVCWDLSLKLIITAPILN